MFYTAGILYYFDTNIAPYTRDEIFKSGALISNR